MSNDRAYRFNMTFAIAAIVMLFIAIVLITEPISQDAAYHQLADQRTWLQIPNFFDVISNLPFAIIGLAGLKRCIANRSRSLGLSWTVFFAGLILIAIGSSHYHWRPDNASLFWDRMPMTISFMALLAALLTENLWPRLEPILLPGAVTLGLCSVLYWRIYGDLRLYAFVQFGTLIAIPFIVASTNGRYSQRHYFLYALLWYVLAKVFEINDHEIFRLTGQTLSGHTAKHLAAAAATYCVYLMLKRRGQLVRGNID